jgi:lipid A 3-O-deacylase
MRSDLKEFSKFLLVCSVLSIVGGGSSLARADDAVNNTSKNLRDRIAQSAKANEDRSYISIAHENDLLAGSGDKFYTSGIQITYFDIDAAAPIFMERLADKWIGFDVSSATLTSFTLGQKIYTPQDIQISAEQIHDRPWAGWLYGTVGLANVYDDHVDQFGLTMGVVGSASMAEPAQKFIHEYLSDSPEPQGWNNQIHSELGVVLSWDRRWPVWADMKWQGYKLMFEPNISVALGNVYTYGGGGAMVTFGPDRGSVQDTPPRLSPSLPGTGYFDTPDNQWNWYLFSGLNGRVVARDIFLDGNTFRDSASIDKKNFVADANAGLAFTLGDTRIAYTLVYRTREFHEQDEPSVFGSVSLTQRF